MESSLEGFDEMNKKFKELEQNANSISGKNEISFIELFPPLFMNRNTNFKNIDEFVAHSKFDFSNIADIDESQLDKFVASNSQFDSWKAMKVKAMKEWTAKKLGF